MVLSTRQRLIAMAVAVVLGILCAVILDATLWRPIQDVPGAPHTLIANPAFDANKQVPSTPFYDTPKPLPNVIPGTVLKAEPILAGTPAGIRATRIMYMSTKVDGSPVAITGAIFERTDQPPPNGRPLIGFSHGTTGLAPPCGISHAPFIPGNPGNLFWTPEIEPLVQAGYTVVGTDYQNMGAVGSPSYLVVQAEAYAVLDSVRAALQYAPDRLNGNLIGLDGHSQGGQAALGAAEYQQKYAPELAIRGVVSQAPGIIVGLPVIIKQLVQSSSSDPTSSASRAEYLSFLTESWSKTYPGQVIPSEILTPQGLAKLPDTNSLCGTALRDQFTKPLDEYVKSTLPASFLRAANDNVPVSNIPFPLLMTQGMKDVSVVPQMNIAVFDSICRTGANAELRLYPNDDHNSLLWTARTADIDWLNDRMAGKPVANGCQGRH